METFGEWLRQQRDLHKLTREQFAERVGCSVALLRKIEAGERRPSVQIAELMANSLNIPPAESSTFIKVARGEWSMDRLLPISKRITSPDISPAPTPPRIDLPVLPTPLIGRQREVQELCQLLRDPPCRLLTLVGPGGIGKTRLAIETAAHMREVFVDGVFFVPLAPVNSTRFILPVIADAVGFAFQSSGSADPKTQLFGYLKEKQILLVADNLEHLLGEPGIELLAELLANAPLAKLLVTSREALSLQGEWVFEVEGLPIPESGYAEGSTQNTSVELFLQRARRAYVGFNATLDDYPAIVRICQLVDGMPLGIELAAAWVRTLTCSEISREIEQGLDFLSVSARDLPARHRSMRAVFDHSWILLTEEEQGILLRLSVFQGGFRGDAAEVVAGATLSTLSTLVTKSLVRRSGAGRYDLHELIRQFAAEHFAEHPQEQTSTQACHGSYYLTFFRNEDERLRSSAQREVLAELTAEMDNIRTAWNWAITHQEFALIEGTLRTFAIFHDIRGWLREGLDALDRAANALETAQPDRTHQLTLGHLLAARSLLESRLGQYEQAQKILERSLEILRPLNEPRVMVEVISFLGIVMEMTGNYSRALELYSDGLELATTVGDRWYAAVCHTLIIALVGVTHTMVKLEVTHERLQSALADWRTIGDPRFISLVLNNLGWNALALGRYDEACAALEESAALSRSVGDQYALGFAYRGLGIIAQVQGEHLQALESFRKSLATLTELGARQDMARLLAEMSRSIFALGNDAEAGRNWRESLRIAIETRGLFIALESLVGIASLQAKRGDTERALELLLIVLDHPAGNQDTRDRAVDLRDKFIAQLTGRQVESVEGRARTKTFEAVVDEILKQTPFT